MSDETADDRIASDDVSAFDDVAGTEADAADVLDQAEPAGGEPVEAALQARARVVQGDPAEDEREQEDAAEADGGA